MHQALQHSTVTQGVDPQQECWFLRISEDLVFGPVSLDELIGWARTGRIADGYTISQDQDTWYKVEEIPEFGMDWTVNTKSHESFGPFNISAVNHLLKREMIDALAEARNSRTGETRELQARPSTQVIPVADSEDPSIAASVVLPVEDKEGAGDQVAVKPSLVKPVDETVEPAVAKQVSKVVEQTDHASTDSTVPVAESDDSGKTVVMPQSKIKEVVESDDKKPMPSAPDSGNEIADARETIAKLRTENTFLKRQAQAEREGFKRQLNEMMEEYEQAYEDHNRSQQETIVRENSYAAKIKKLEEELTATSKGGSKSSGEIEELKRQLELEAERRENLQKEAVAKQKELQTRIDQLQSASAESVGALEQAREELRVAESTGGTEVQGAEKKVNDLQRQVLSLQAEREKLSKAVRKQQASAEKGDSELSKSEDTLRKRIAELEKRTQLYAEESEKLKKQLAKEKQDFEEARHTVVKQAQSEIDAIKSELAKKDAQITSLKGNNGGENVSDALVRQAEASEKRALGAESRVKDLEVKTSEQATQIDKATDRIKSLEKDAETFFKQETALSELKATLEQLQAENSGLKTDLKRAGDTHAKLQADVGSQAGSSDPENVTSLKSELAALQKSLDSAESKLSQREASLKTLESRTATDAQEKDALEKRVRDAGEELVGLKKQLQQSEQSLKAAEDRADKLSAAENEKSSLETALGDAQLRADAAQSQLNDQRDKIASLENENTSLQSALQKANSQADPSLVKARVDAALSKAEKAFQSRLADEQGRLEGQIQVAESKMADLQQALEDARSSQAKLREENTQLSLKASEDFDSAKVADLEKAVFDMQDRCDKLIASVDSERATRDALKEEFGRLEARYKTRISELEDAGKGVLAELADARRVIEDLQRQNSAIREAAANDADQLTRQIQDEISRLKKAAAENRGLSGKVVSGKVSETAKSAPSATPAAAVPGHSVTTAEEPELETVPTLKDVLGSRQSGAQESKQAAAAAKKVSGETPAPKSESSVQSEKPKVEPGVASTAPAKEKTASLEAKDGKDAENRAKPHISDASVKIATEKRTHDSGRTAEPIDKPFAAKESPKKAETASAKAKDDSSPTDKTGEPPAREPEKGKQRRHSDDVVKPSVPTTKKKADPTAAEDDVSPPPSSGDKVAATSDLRETVQGVMPSQPREGRPGARQLQTNSAKDAVSSKAGAQKPEFAQKGKGLPIPSGPNKPAEHTGPAVKNDDVVLKGHSRPSPTIETKQISPVKQPRPPAQASAAGETVAEPQKETSPKAPEVGSPSTSGQAAPAAKNIQAVDTPKTISPKKQQKPVPEKYYLKIDDDQVFGPESVEVLRDWAGQLRVSPDHQLSLDKKKWTDASDVPGLEMNWLVEVEEGNYYGPFNAAGVKSLFKDQVITPETPVFNNKTESAGSASDVLDKP